MIPEFSLFESTMGSCLDVHMPMYINNRTMFHNVREKTVGCIHDSELREKAMRFLDVLEWMVSTRGICRDLPRIVTDFSRREAYYEWIFPDFTMGFVIDKDETEDGWFIILDECLGGKMVMDKLDHSLRVAIDFMAEYVSRNRISGQMRPWIVDEA